MKYFGAAIWLHRLSTSRRAVRTHSLPFQNEAPSGCGLRLSSTGNIGGGSVYGRSLKSERVPRSRRYLLLRDGYSVCLVFLKLCERIYAPLTGGCCRQSSQTENRNTISALNVAGSVSTSSTISANSWMPSVSRPRKPRATRTNSRHAAQNGLTTKLKEQ